MQHFSIGLRADHRIRAEADCCFGDAGLACFLPLARIAGFEDSSCRDKRN